MRSRAFLPLMGLAALLAMTFLFMVDHPLYVLIQTKWGAGPYLTPFIDLEYIGVGAECWAKGINVYVTNPCDVMDRAHTYSPLWLRLSFIPTGRTWTNILGLGLATLFILSLAWLLRPRRPRDLVVFALVLLSSASAFAVERGNVDTLMFLFLVAAVALSAGSLRLRLLSYAVVLLAGLLKFYPLAGLLYALRERTPVALAIAAASTLAVLAFLGFYAHELREMAANIPSGSPFDEKWGARNLPLGLSNGVLRVLPFLRGTPAEPLVRPAILLAFLLPSCLLAWFWTARTTLPAALARLNPREEATLLYGALMVAGCFFAGQSIAYRGIWFLFVAAGLMALWREAATPALRRAIAAIVAIVLLVVWDGLVRSALRDTPNDPTVWFSIYWLAREILWWVLIAFLLAAIACFTLRTPLAAALLRRPPPAPPSPAPPVPA